MKRKPLSLSIHVALGLALGLAATASAQSSPQAADAATGIQSEDATRLDAITVTARRREESLQDVPVAVTAFGEEDLAELQANNIDGLQGAVPNLNIVQGRGSANSVNVFIRGIGQPDALHTFDPGVGIYVDDVYFSRINGALLSLFDVEQVEVLRGPQGTLYGKNSTGGAIRINTRDPGYSPNGSFELGLGDFGRRFGNVYAASPLGETVSVSLAGSINQHDGFVRDSAGRQFGDDDTRAVRLRVVGEPSEAFRYALSLDHTRQRADLTMGRPMAPLVQTDLAFGPVVLRPADGSTWDYRGETSFGPDNGQSMNHWGSSLSMDWTLSPQWLLRSITAYRELTTRSFIDIDASEFELGDVFVGLDQDQASQEFQLQYDGERTQAVYGVYYLRESVPSQQEAYADDLFALAGTPISFLRTIEDDLTTTSYAAFAHVSRALADSWTLAAGLRYTRETKAYDRSTSTFWGAPFQALNETVAFSGRQSWSAWTPSVSLQKAFSDQVMGYVSASRGFKSGGFNGRANSLADAANPVFDPETVWTYELGLKSASADGRLLGNVAVFHSDYKDFQARVSQDVGSFPVLNAAELTIRGVELEGAMLIGEGTRLSGQLGWLDARYDRFDDFRMDPDFPGFNPTVRHDHVPFSPEWTARVALTHTFRLAGGSGLTVGGDVSYRDDVWLSVDNRDVLKQDAYSLVGLFGVWDSADMRWQVRAGVRNLTDKVYKTEGQEFASVGNIQTAYYGWPRNYQLSVRYSF